MPFGWQDRSKRRAGRTARPVGSEVEQLVFQPGAANFALHKIGLELGMFSEKRELHLKTDLSDLTDAQLLRRYQQEAQRLLERGDIIDAEVVDDVATSNVV